MKWRFGLISLVALGAISAFLLYQQWWAATTFLSLCGGICHERRQLRLEAEDDEAMEERGSLEGFGAFLLFCCLVFAASASWGLFQTLGWWSIGVGILNVAVFVFAAVMYGEPADKTSKLAPH